MNKIQDDHTAFTKITTQINAISKKYKYAANLLVQQIGVCNEQL